MNYLMVRYLLQKWQSWLIYQQMQQRF